MAPRAPRAEEIPATPEPEPAPQVEAPPAEPTPPPAPAEPARVPDGNTVYIRSAPAAFAFMGRALGNTQAPWFPDMVELGIGLGRLDGSVILRSQSPAAGPGDFGAYLPSVAVSYRPLRTQALSLLDVYFQGSLGGGGVGTLIRAPTCDLSRLRPEQCGNSHDGWGVGPSLGVGVEFNIRLGPVPGGQTAFLTIGIEARGHWIVSVLPTGVEAPLFGVVSLPLGFRFE